MRIIKSKDIDKAVAKFKKGGGRKVTKEELDAMGTDFSGS